VPIEEVTHTVEGPLFISLSGLPVDQQRAIRTLVDALAYVEEPRRAMEDA
jgi:hypothetical protein